MSFFDDVGSFLGSIFNPNQKKKDQQPTPQPVTMQAPKPTGVTISAPKPIGIPIDNTSQPTVVPLVNTAPKPQKPQATVEKPKSFLDNLADFGGSVGKIAGDTANNVGHFVDDTVKNTGGMIHDFSTDPNNVPRNTLDYITGTHNPLDGATYDYQHKQPNGQPSLILKAPPTNYKDMVNSTLGGTLFDKLIAEPTQQGLGLLGDVAVEGGSLIGSIPNPLLNEQQNAQRQAENLANSEMLRNKIHGIQTIGGQQIEGTQGADESGARIANGNATPGDFGNVAMTGLNTGLAATVLDPANLINPIKSLRANFSRTAARDGEEVGIQGAVRNAEEDLAPQTARPGETAPAPETPIEPNSPITSSPTTNKAPAITSPNFTAPSVQAPRPLFESGAPTGAPVAGGIPKTTVPSVVKPTAAPISTADEATAAAQKAIDEAAIAQPKPSEAPVETVPVESPSTATAQEVANTATPPNPEAVAAAQAKEAAAAAPTEATGREVPNYTPPVSKGKASVGGTSKATYTTGDENLDGIVHDSLIAHKGTAGTAAQRAEALDKAGITADQRAAIRDVATHNVNRETGEITPAGKSQIEDIIKGNKPVSSTVQDAKVVSEKAASDTPKNNLGSITKNAVSDGSIRTSEGIAKAEADVHEAAHAAADASGMKLDAIIKKGQAAWEKSRGKADITDAEAGLTKEQGDVYRNLSQEIGTLRDRIDPSLRTGGDQGKWYLPRQAVDELGDSQAYDSRLVNELARDKTPGGGVTADVLDTSTTPIQHAIRRYANGADGLTQKFTSTVEDTAGVKVPEPAKANLKQNIQDAIDARDEARLASDAGDDQGILEANKKANDAFDKAITDLAKDIPGKGKARQQAIDELKKERDTFVQSSTQTLSLSNVVNRTADQVQKLTEVFKNAAIPAASRVAGKIAGIKAPEESLLNASKEARQASKNVSRGTLAADTGANFRSTVRLAGAGRSLIPKAIAKADAVFRGGGTALTSSADLLTQNTRLAHMLSLSRPEAAGLKTTAEFEKYMRSNAGSAAFKEDLKAAEQINNPHIGLAGGRNEQIGNGKISSFLSKNIDNGISNALKDKGVPQRFVQEVNDYVKSRITGYAGVASRIFGTGVNAAALGIPRFRAAAELAASGAPNAVAQAQAMAAHSVLDTMSLYGTAGLTALLASNKVLGFTGSQPDAGSSEAARWKKDNIPAGTFYINLPGGKPLYFQPARALGMDGVVANIVAGVATGSGDIASNVGDAFGQIADNLGGSSLIQTLGTAQNYLSTSSQSQKDYDSGQLQRTAVPGMGFINNIANWGDVYKRDPKGFVQNFEANVPGLRNNVPIATDTSGNPIENSKQISGGSSLFSIGTEGSQTPGAVTANPVDDEVRRLAGITGADGSKLEVTPTAANSNATIKKNSVFAKTLLNDPLYQNASDDEKAGYLKEVLAGTSTKGINASISDAGKQALLDHKILGDKAAAWLDDNTNNANYSTGVYDNAKANGTLTAADKDLTNPKGLQYKAVAAQVDQKVNADYALKNDYSGTSQSEFKSLLNPKSDTYDPEAAQKLYDYDQARVKAGLPPKFNLAKAQKGAAGSGSKGFSFASLPGSLLGGSKSGSGASSSYAKDAPLFTPIKDLTAPPTVAIPTGRSISVKQGVQL